MRRMALVLVLVALPLVWAGTRRNGEACAIAPRFRDSQIVIAEENALIVWDANRKIQHFIRWAAFDTKDPDFGFLVPTPTKPELAEVDDGLFSAIDQWTRPKTVTRYQPMFLSCCLSPFLMTMSKMEMKDTAGSVRVLHTQRVGGFDAAVLEADSTEELDRWLAEHKYTSGPRLASWLAPYVANHWKITAFKIARPEGSETVVTKPVRMSFATEEPFFPYREPTGDAEKPGPNPPRRLLRVSFVSTERAEGQFGQRASWPGIVKWSDRLESENRSQLLALTGLKDADVPTKAWMTMFEDASSPRPGTEEVFFTPAKDQTPIVPAPFVNWVDIPIPVDLIVLGGGALLLAVVLIRRRRRNPVA